MIGNGDLKFCMVCGAPTEIVPMRGFDRTTGEPNQQRVCSKVGCPEYCHGHGGHDYKRTGFWKPDVCTRCGETPMVWD